MESEVRREEVSVGWEDTVLKYRDRISSLCPEWTDYNVSDPGITLLELMVWFSQIQEFHVRQIGEEHEIKLRKLLGIKGREREPAHVLITLNCKESRKVLKGQRFFVEQLCFEAKEEQVAEENIFSGFCSEYEGSRWQLSGEWLADGKNIRIYPFGEKPQAGSCFTVCLKRRLPTGEKLRLYLGMEDSDGEAWDETVYGPEGFYPLADAVMEYRFGGAWVPVSVELDETKSLQKSGSLLFRLSQDMDQEDPCLRIRLLRAEYITPPVIRRISLAMVELLQQETAENLPVFWGNGFPGQCFDTEERTLYQQSLELEAEAVRGWDDERKDGGMEKHMEVWKRVEDFERSSTSDRHYRMKNGILIFGDGIHGMPPEGSLRIVHMVRTYGKAGNIKAGSVFLEAGDGETADRRTGTAGVNESEGRGGSDEETLQESLSRWKYEQSLPSRCVTPEDCRRLVMAAPGLQIEDCSAYYVRPEADEISIAVSPVLNEAVKKNLQRYLGSRRLLGMGVRLVAPLRIGLRIICEAVGKTQYPGAEKQLRKAVTAWAASHTLGQTLERGKLYLLLDELPAIRKIRVLELDAGIGTKRNAGGDVILPPHGLAVLENFECTLVPEQEGTV